MISHVFVFSRTTHVATAPPELARVFIKIRSVISELRWPKFGHSRYFGFYVQLPVPRYKQ